MPQVQNWSLDLLTNGPICYQNVKHCHNASVEEIIEFQTWKWLVLEATILHCPRKTSANEMNFSYESWPRCRTNHLTCWPVVQSATKIPQWTGNHWVSYRENPLQVEFRYKQSTYILRQSRVWTCTHSPAPVWAHSARYPQPDPEPSPATHITLVSIVKEMKRLVF